MNLGSRSLFILGAALAWAGVSVAAPPSAGKARGTASPRPCVAFSPDGKTLAAGGYGEVTLIDAGTGRRLAALSGHPAAVTSVAFSPDGKTLAAAGGQPGQGGEIRLWDLAGRTARVLSGAHDDVIYSVAWSPDGRTLAAGSYDRLLSLWDVASGDHRLLKDHTDAVYAVAFSPDGTRVASASGDRTVKVWDAASGRRLFTLSEATAELYTVAFHPSGREIAAAGVDKMLRKWSVTPTAGMLARSAFAHDGPILRVVYSRDGGGVFTSSEDRSVKLWDAAALREQKVFEEQPDWALGLAVSPDGSRLAVSRYDGSIAVYDVESGDRVFP
jgi:WD40 repeat protein